jgi:hypothetical protein
MEITVKACLEGKASTGAVKEFQVPLMTLKCYIRKQWEQEFQISYIYIHEVCPKSIRPWAGKKKFCIWVVTQYLIPFKVGPL